MSETVYCTAVENLLDFCITLVRGFRTYFPKMRNGTRAAVIRASEGNLRSPQDTFTLL